MPNMEGMLLGPGSLAIAGAKPYDTSYLWKNGEYCSKDGKIYKFIGTDLSSGEAWNSAHWENVKLADEIQNNTEDIQTVDNRVDLTNSDIGIVEDTNTAVHSISKGQYVIWKGSLYKATAAIAIGTTLSGSNLTPDSNGAANSLQSQITSLSNHIGTVYEENLTASNVTFSYYVSANVVFLRAVIPAQNANTWFSYDISSKLPAKYYPPVEANGNFNSSGGSDEGKPSSVTINQSGVISGKTASGSNWSYSRVATFTYVVK